jgi:hypothetical protein
MPIWAKDNRKAHPPCPEGLHQGVCVDVVDLGPQETPWGLKPQVRLYWQLDALRDDGKPHLVSKFYNNSLNQKSTLCAHLEAWRGRKFTDKEREGFDLETVLGVNCQIQVVHKLADDGRVFANVQAIVPLGKGMVKMQAQDYTRVCDKERERRVSEDWEDERRRAQGAGADEAVEDDIPF